jgi:serine/threonine protein kinase
MRKYSHDAEKYDNYLNKYEIIKELGKGMYGVVHLARKKVSNDERNGKIRNYSLKLHVWRDGDK